MTTSQPDFMLNRPGALIAALPAVLGFVPEKSLVLVTVDRGEMGAVMRIDLSPRIADTVDRVADVAAAGRPDAAIAVIVDADGALCPMCADEHRELAATLSEVLELQGITLIAAHVVDRIAAGGTWHCADMCGARGTVDDPAASPLAMAAVLDGRRLYGRREELHQIIEATDQARVNRLARMVRKELKNRQATRTGDADAWARGEIEYAMGVASRVADCEELTDAEAAALACGLNDVTVRDTLYALAVGDEAGAAEALWAALSRILPDRWRVEALALLAFSAYARGDGPLAGVALDAALRCDSQHRMASMLDSALQSGMRPEQIRELAGTGYRLADRLGVSLPPRRAFGRRAG
jgi:alkylhydroperoxidase/carboxymuconolactone decarboxylase family protein YurZ